MSIGYTARITNTPTGETREYTFDYPWEDHSDFLWSEGNFGCDCNRGLFFARAAGIPEDEIEDVYCGVTRFHVAIMIGGKIIYEDD